MTKYKTSAAGIALIKRFEGCRLTAYRCAAGAWTIGWGHTGGVKRGQKITKEQAEKLLKTDLQRFEKAVNECRYIGWTMTQGQFDALVSFAFNCGVGNLKNLCQGRDAETVAVKMMLYVKAAGVTLEGLKERRAAEQKLFLSGRTINVCPYAEPKRTVTSKRNAEATGCKQYIRTGSGVSWLQWMLNATGEYRLAVDGICGSITTVAIKDFQRIHGLVDDGLAGVKTREALKKAVR